MVGKAKHFKLKMIYRRACAASGLQWKGRRVVPAGDTVHPKVSGGRLAGARMCGRCTQEGDNALKIWKNAFIRRYFSCYIACLQYFVTKKGRKNDGGNGEYVPQVRKTAARSGCFFRSIFPAFRRRRRMGAERVCGRRKEQRPASAGAVGRPRRILPEKACRTAVFAASPEPGLPVFKFCVVRLSCIFSDFAPIWR